MKKPIPQVHISPIFRARGGVHYRESGGIAAIARGDRSGLPPVCLVQSSMPVTVRATTCLSPYRRRQPVGPAYSHSPSACSNFRLHLVPTKRDPFRAPADKGGVASAGSAMRSAVGERP
jgi:hypothetical protein